MKIKNIIPVVILAMILIIIASTKDNKPTDNTYKAVKIGSYDDSNAKISPISEKNENIPPIVQKQNILETSSPKEVNKLYTPIKKETEPKMLSVKQEQDDKISVPKIPTKKEDQPLKINYSIGVKYKQVESLVAQDNYLGFSFNETHNEFNGKMALTDKKYFVELNLSSIDNSTMAVSYLNYGIALGHNLNDNLELGLEYQKNNLVYRSDYHLNFEQVSQAGISAKYEISDADNYKISSKAKYLYAEKDTQREFLLNLEIPMNEIDLGIGYGINDRESNIDNSHYKGNYKRKDEILEFGVNYKF